MIVLVGGFKQPELAGRSYVHIRFFGVHVGQGLMVYFRPSVKKGVVFISASAKVDEVGEDAAMGH